MKYSYHEFHKQSFITNIIIEDSAFIGSSGVQHGTINGKHIALSVRRCDFILTKHSKPPPLGALVYLENSMMSASDVTFDASESTSAPMSLVYILFPVAIIFNKTSMMCPVSFDVRVKYDKMLDWSCEQMCENNTFSLGGASVAFSGFVNQSNFSRSMDLTVSHKNPVCYPCPVGAICEDGGGIRSLPNYWGYKDDNDFVTMIRCPDGYCCTDYETCDSMNSCQTKRSGTLCGSCEKNWTESLFDPKCVSADKCQRGLILTLYLFCVWTYVALLLSRRAIKDLATNLGNILVRRCVEQGGNRNKNTEDKGEIFSDNKKQENKQLELAIFKGARDDNDETDRSNVPEASDKEQQDTEIQTKRTSSFSEENSDTQSKTDEDSGMKYMQILFYYVQDASLFKVQVPNEQQKGKSLIIKIIEFSPEVMSSVYTSVTNLCFCEDTTAVTKIIFKCLFGPSVMLCLLFLYLLQNFIVRFFQTDPKFWECLKSCLLQAFLVTMLFCYQKIVTGVFTLVQCVDVGDEKVLYIQGDIVCYTWWQIMIKVYICLSVVPVFLVLSHYPFSVQDKAMSVRMFVLACLLPLPVMIVQCVQSCSEPQKTDDTKNGSMSSRESSNNSESAIGSEQQAVEQVPRTPQTRDSQQDTADSDQSVEDILHTLLHHYRTLKVWGVQFTWLGVHKLYRISLVACNTYITDPVTKLFTMSGALVVITFANMVLMPYKDQKANMTASFSYMANICIALINVIKSGMVLYGCQTNCQHRNILLEYLGICETILLVYVPIIALCLWLLAKGAKKCKCQDKQLQNCGF